MCRQGPRHLHHPYTLPPLGPQSAPSRRCRTADASSDWPRTERAVSLQPTSQSDSPISTRSLQPGCQRPELQRGEDGSGDAAGDAACLMPEERVDRFARGPDKLPVPGATVPCPWLNPQRGCVGRSKAAPGAAPCVVTACVIDAAQQLGGGGLGRGGRLPTRRPLAAARRRRCQCLQAASHLQSHVCSSAAPPRPCTIGKTLRCLLLASHGVSEAGGGGGEGLPPLRRPSPPPPHPAPAPNPKCLLFA